MNDLKKAIGLALFALNSCDFDFDSEENEYKTFDEDLVEKASCALRQALAQPENPLDIADRAYFSGKQDGIAERQWVSLTDEESSDIYNAHHNTYGECITSAYDLVLDVEAKLKEKNGG